MFTIRQQSRKFDLMTLYTLKNNERSEFDKRKQECRKCSFYVLVILYPSLSLSLLVLWHVFNTCVHELYRFKIRSTGSIRENSSDDLLFSLSFSSRDYFCFVHARIQAKLFKL